MSQKSPKLKLTEDELDKVAKARAKREGIKVDQDWLFVAEFGSYFGWAGVQAIRNNELSMEEANMILAGARKVWSGKLYDYAMSVLIGAGSANSKKPNQTFKKATRGLIKQAKADT